MRVLPLWISAAFVLSPAFAHATTIYDSVDLNPADFNGDSVSVDPTVNGPEAAEFSITSIQTLNLVSLELSAGSPSDGGSLTVELVLNSGTMPSYRFDPYPSAGFLTNGITTFPNATVLATILDSTLSTSPSLVSISTSVVLTPGSYWIGLESPQLPSSILAGDTQVNGKYGSGQWWYSNDTDPPPDSGVPGQLNFSSGDGPASFPIDGPDATFGGPFEMILNASQGAPEPGTFAILSSGLAGLGYFRRRKAKKA
jgi:hypothetical protein